MDLDKYIKVKMLELSKKYEISLVEIQKVRKLAKKKYISRCFNFNYRLKKNSPEDNRHMTFYNKRDLVSWLMCLE